ncbi:MAG: hypothetical protein P1S60_19730, partial [Anaerolineae bacterium]|nr:hypothetical protein [Anaerolineae bacterium]
EILADTVRLTLGTERREVVMQLLKAWLDKDLNRGLVVINDAMDNGADPRQLARQTTDFLRGLLLMRLGAGDTWPDPTVEERPLFEEMARSANMDDLVKAVEVFSEAAEKRWTSWQPQLALELAFVQAAREEEAVKAQPDPAPASVHAQSRKTRLDSTQVQPAPKSPVKTHQPVVPGSSEPAVVAAVPSRVKEPAGKIKDNDTTLVEGRIRESWQDILRLIRPVSLGALLRDADISGMDEQNRLVLSFQHTFHCEKVNDPASRRALEDVLSENLNVQIYVRCVMAGEWQPPQSGTAPSDHDVPVAAGPAEVEDDTLVRRAQEELGAVARIDER